MCGQSQAKRSKHVKWSIPVVAFPCLHLCLYKNQHSPAHFVAFARQSWPRWIAEEMKQAKNIQIWYYTRCMIRRVNAREHLPARDSDNNDGVPEPNRRVIYEQEELGAGVLSLCASRRFRQICLLIVPSSPSLDACLPPVHMDSEASKQEGWWRRSVQIKELPSEFKIKCAS